MPVLTFELRRQIASFLGASLLLAALLAGALLGLWPVFRDAQADVAAILASYPPEFLEAFGAGGDVLSFSGFLSFIALYLELTAAVAGFAWGLGSFGRERRDRCEDFLLAMPQSRASVFVQKLLTCLTGVAVLTAAATLTATGVAAQADLGVDEGRLALAAAGMGGVALVFVAAGALVGVLAPRVRSVSGTSAFVGVAAFVLGVLPELTGEGRLKAISPLSWFAPAPVMDGGSFDGGQLVTAAVVTVALLACALVAYARSDVRAD